MHLLLLFFPCLFRSFFGFEALFGLVSLALQALRGCVGFLGPFKLIVSGIQAHLQEPFSPGAPLIEVNIFLNLGLGLSVIGHTD